MTSTETTPTSNNVVYMGDFLLRRLKLYMGKKEHLCHIAGTVSKSENPRNDAFAGPLLAKADKFNEPIEALQRHIRFIMHGGNHSPVKPNSGYSLQYPPAPPVRITITPII